MTLFRSAFIIAFFISISRILGFIRDIIIAKFIGVSFLSDVFFAAFKLPNFFRRVFAEGAFNSSFVPIFVKKLKDNNRKARALVFARNIFSLLFFIVLTLVILMEIFMPFVIMALFPGFKFGSEKFLLLVELSRITIFYLLFISLVSLFSGILNSINKFVASSSVSIILNLTLIASVYLLSDFTKNVAYALSWGVFIAGVLQFFWLLFFIIKERMFIYPTFPKINKDMKIFFKKLIPGVIAANVMQINMFVDTIIASLISGAISYLYYADRINQLPLAMIGIAIGVALLPALSNKIKNHQYDEAIKLQNVALKVGLILVIPAMLALNCLSFEIIQTLFERGKFDHNATIMVSKALFLYSIGLPAFVLVKIFEPSFFARGNTKTPMKIAIICLVANVVLNLIFFKPFGYLGIILASVLSSYLNLTLMVTQLIKKDYFKFENDFIKNLIQIIIPASFMLIFLIIFKNYFANSQKLNQISELIILITSGLVIYGSISYFVGNTKLLSTYLTRKQK